MCFVNFKFGDRSDLNGNGNGKTWINISSRVDV